MTWRVKLCKTLFRLADLLKSLGPFLMKPEDLIAFSRSCYANPKQVKWWSDPQYSEIGLYDNEVNLLERIPVRTGRLLLLGVGGGREAIPLAQRGFEVTGVDHVPEMVARAQANARRHNLDIQGLVQDVTNLEVPQNYFDVIWFSTALYSTIPTRSRRIAVLHCIFNALRPQGCVVCQFNWNPHGAVFSPRGKRLRTLVARLTFGNREFEDGDQLSGDREFIHSFRRTSDLISELEASGFSIYHLETYDEICQGGAILMKGAI
jgi:ubiquinone/menaquinone biosynthesis C-methylase UbiE